MTQSLRACAVLSIGCCVAVGAQTPPGKAAPHVTCEIAKGDGVEFRKGEPVRVSNLRLIPLNVSFTGGDIPRVGQVRSASEAATATSSVSIEVTMAGAGKGNSIPIKTALLGSGQTTTEHHLSVIVQIPIDDKDRDAQEMGYIEFLASTVDKESPPLDPMILALYKNTNSKVTLARAFDRTFLENRVGSFDVTCTYTSKVPGSWNGEVRAAPLRIDVVFAGHFFDQPQFKQKPGAR